VLKAENRAGRHYIPKDTIIKVIVLALVNKVAGDNLKNISSVL